MVNIQLGSVKKLRTFFTFIKSALYLKNQKFFLFSYKRHTNKFAGLIKYVKDILTKVVLISILIQLYSVSYKLNPIYLIL